MNWSALLRDFDCALLIELGEDPDFLPTDYNPITEALKSPDFVERFEGIRGFNRTALSKTATICQMVVFDAKGGPEGDGKPKALRRHWYSWYKSDFAQPLAFQIGDTEVNAQGVREMKDLSWTARLSRTYAHFVDDGVTYKDLWVEDASRMMAQNLEILFGGCHIIVAVEKDSLFADFDAPAKALGAKAVYSGKGKSSKAAIEKLLRDHFGWSANHNPFYEDTPLIILHISDHDFDGEAVIGPTFAEQARRYTSYILEARVGIKPENVKDAGHTWEDKWYQVKIGNKGYVRWAEEKALFLATCEWCNYSWAVKGIAPQACPKCDGQATVLEIGQDTAHGFEVEALTTRDYYGLLVDALLQVLPFEYIVKRLREECRADSYTAANRIRDDILEYNESYQALLEEFDRLEDIKSEFENRIHEQMRELGEPHISDWEMDDPDPLPIHYRTHVEGARDFATPWRPFSVNARTQRLAEFLQEQERPTIREFENEVISW